MKRLMIIFVCCLTGFAVDLSNSKDAEAGWFNKTGLTVRVRHYDRNARREKPVSGASVKVSSSQDGTRRLYGYRGNYSRWGINKRRCYSALVDSRNIGCPSKKWNTRCCSGGIKSSGRGWMVVTHYK